MSHVIIVNGNFNTQNTVCENSVDLIVTSPPYGLDMQYGESPDKSDDYEVYQKFTEAWLCESLRLAKPDGRLCVNVPLDKNRGGKRPVYSDVLQWAKLAGWKYHTSIVWNEGNVSRRTAWGSWKSSSAPFVTAPVEMIIVLYKDVWKKNKVAGRTDTIERDEFIAWTNGLWTFNGESAKRIGHPAPFPRELPKRCIKLFSRTGDVVLDPFVGSGTTLVEALANGRRGIGFETNPAFCELARKRIIKEATQH